MSYTYLLTYSRSRLLLKKLTDFQLVKIFSTFYGSRTFISTFTIARHLTLNLSSNQFTFFILHSAMTFIMGRFLYTI